MSLEDGCCSEDLCVCGRFDPDIPGRSVLKGWCAAAGTFTTTATRLCSLVIVPCLEIGEGIRSANPSSEGEYTILQMLKGHFWGSAGLKS